MINWILGIGAIGLWLGVILFRGRQLAADNREAAAEAANRNANDLRDNEEIIATFLAAHPNSVNAAIRYAQQAAARGDREEALARWHRVIARFPTHADAYTNAIGILRGLGRLDEADALLAKGLQRCKPVEHLDVSHALAAHVRRDWPEAARRWAAIRQHYPSNGDGYTRGAEALRHMGETETADQLAADWAEIQARKAR